MAYDLHVLRPEPPALLDLRADATAATLFAGELGVALPARTPGAATHGDITLLHIGPDHWLLCAPMHQEITLAARLDRTIATRHAMVTVVSDAWRLLRLRGNGIREVLAQGVAIDLEDHAFPCGSATRCAFGKVSAVLHRVDEAGTRPYWDVYVDSPLERYACQWLEMARTVGASR